MKEHAETATGEGVPQGDPSDLLGNFYDVKHECHQNGVGQWSGTLGDVRRCSCGRLYIWWYRTIGQGWIRLRGRKRRRWERDHSGSNARAGRTGTNEGNARP